jgi:hypothetical protein
MTTRTHVQTERRVPTNVNEWNTLLTLSIRKAEALQDSRLPGLRKAMVEGKAEPFLRRMGIISQVDIEREFPDGG